MPNIFKDRLPALPSRASFIPLQRLPPAPPIPPRNLIPISENAASLARPGPSNQGVLTRSISLPSSIDSAGTYTLAESHRAAASMLNTESSMRSQILRRISPRMETLKAVAKNSAIALAATGGSIEIIRIFSESKKPTAEDIAYHLDALGIKKISTTPAPTSKSPIKIITTSTSKPSRKIITTSASKPTKKIITTSTAKPTAKPEIDNPIGHRQGREKGGFNATYIVRVAYSNYESLNGTTANNQTKVIGHSVQPYATTKPPNKTGQIYVKIWPTPEIEYPPTKPSTATKKATFATRQPWSTIVTIANAKVLYDKLHPTTAMPSSIATTATSTAYSTSQVKSTAVVSSTEKVTAVLLLNITSTTATTTTEAVSSSTVEMNNDIGRYNYSLCVFFSLFSVSRHI